MTFFEVRDLSVRIGEKEAVSHVSFSLAAGDVAGIVGPNGSGKSTLLNALMGHPHCTVSEGEILFDGEGVSSLSPDERARKGMFLSLQHTPKVGGITLATFLHTAERVRTGEQVDPLEHYLRMRDLADSFGIRNDLLDRPLSEGLSGGERKLSEMLQLVAFKPRIALLDEVDSGVDADALRVVCSAIARMSREGSAFLIVSHHPSLFERLSPGRVYLMSEGRMVRSGGAELAAQVHREGFCRAIECPMADTCAAGDVK